MLLSEENEQQSRAKMLGNLLPTMTLARQKVLWAYIFLSIPIVFFLYIRIYPTLSAFQMSLYDFNPLAEEQPYVGLENYETLLEEVSKPRSPTKSAFENTFKYILIGMPPPTRAGAGYCDDVG